MGTALDPIVRCKRSFNKKGGHPFREPERKNHNKGGDISDKHRVWKREIVTSQNKIKRIKETQMD